VLASHHRSPKPRCSEKTVGSALRGLIAQNVYVNALVLVQKNRPGSWHTSTFQMDRASFLSTFPSVIRPARTLGRSVAAHKGKPAVLLAVIQSMGEAVSSTTREQLMPILLWMMPPILLCPSFEQVCAPARPYSAKFGDGPSFLRNRHHGRNGQHLRSSAWSVGSLRYGAVSRQGVADQLIPYCHKVSGSFPTGFSSPYGPAERDVRVQFPTNAMKT